MAVPGAAHHASLALVNSVGERGRGDDLATPESLRDWLLARDLIDEGAVLHEYCRGRMVGLRESLRELFAAHVDAVAPSPDAVQALNDALTSAPGALLLHFEPTAGFSRRADHAVTQVVERIMALIADDAAALLTGDAASVLARCEAERCGRFFLRTHARRQWCSNRCGDRVRAGRAYARRRMAGAAVT